MTVEALYWKNHVKYKREYDTVDEAAEMMLESWSMGWLNPIGILENGDMVLCHDDILEWGEDDEAV